MTADFVKNKTSNNIREKHWDKTVEVFKTQITVDLSKIG